MATTPRGRMKSWRKKVLEATPTSAQFQEAMRLCRYHHEDMQHYHQGSETDDHSTTSLSAESNNDDSCGTPPPRRGARALSLFLEEDPDSRSEDFTGAGAVASGSISSRRRGSVQWADQSSQKSLHSTAPLSPPQHHPHHQQQQQQQHQQTPRSKRFPRRSSLPPEPMSPRKSILKAMQ